jgi:hypothetical protein
MPVLFISHSSKDDAVARTLEAWLRANGFTDIFIDHTSIVVGEKWAEALREAPGTCRVVACLVTQPWLASDECFGEYKAAWYLGKRIIPLFLLAPKAKLGADAKKRFADICAEYQGLDLTPCLKSDGLDLDADRGVAERLAEGLRAAGALAEAGLDPQAFAIDRKLRPMPFLGLASFGDEDADAALFYGRSGEIAETLEELRQMRVKAERRPFVILGASGAGKSSLLRAGIIPRLRREAPAWLPLRAFRPGADPLLNFAETLTRTLADFGVAEALGDMRSRLDEAWRKAARGADDRLTPEGLGTLQAALEAEGRRLREAAGRGAASILVSVDQAEELARAEGDSGEALADYLRVALLAATSWHLAFTIRNDSLPELQSHRRFQDLKLHPYDLRALPVFRFESVIEAPAKRYGVAVDSKLVGALVEHAPKDDTLPLLAFALQRLWRQFAAKRALVRDHYDRIGGLKGLIEDAAERALRGLSPEEDVPLPPGPAPKRRDDLGAAAFVPALAQINDQGAFIRRLAAWNGFSDEQRELLNRFDQWRLVVRKRTDAGEVAGGTVEVAHEALLREWTRLKGWLEPERARLEVLRSLQVDATTWDRNGRDAAFLNHRDKRLGEATAVVGIERYRQPLGQLEFDYVADCQAAEKLAYSTQALVGSVLTVVFVMLVQVLIYVPSIANFRMTWLNDRLASAHTAALVLDAAPSGMVPESLAKQILDSIGARAVAMKMDQQRRLLATSNLPSEVQQEVDVRDMGAGEAIVEGFRTLLFDRNDDIIRAIGPAPIGGEFVEIVLDEAPLRQAMWRYSRNVLVISLLSAAISAALVYFALLFVRPLRQTVTMIWRYLRWRNSNDG